jgi:hypothetical protein
MRHDSARRHRRVIRAGDTQCLRALAHDDAVAVAVDPVGTPAFRPLDQQRFALRAFGTAQRAVAYRSASSRVRSVRVP